MHKKFIKIGEKKRHLVIPIGWELLDGSKILRSDDMVANLHVVKWERVGNEDAGELVELYDHVIRETLS